MLVPNKYETLSQSILNIGKETVDIIKDKEVNIYALYKLLIEKNKQEFEVSLDKFFYTLDFLYALNLINLKEGRISLI